MNVATTPTPATLQLKALWRAHPALSTCGTLADKLAALDAIKAGATPVEAILVQQGYTLPDGMTWADVAAHRARWDIQAPHMVPLSRGGGAMSWGTPMLHGPHPRGGRFMLHPGNVDSPRTPHAQGRF